MAINTLAPPTDDYINLAAFPGFASFVHPVHDASPPEISECSPDSDVPAAADAVEEEEDDDDSLLPGDGKRGNASAHLVKRSKASSAERRATHNAIERARRESLNGRFMELANALPTMANVKRPSKSVIVNKSLEWIYESQVREQALVRENGALRAELNEMRARLSLPPLPPPVPMPLPSDYGRFKAGTSGLGLGSAALDGVIRHASMPDSYFAANAALGVGSLTALHHPSHLAASFGGQIGIPAPPPSAPANMLTFANASPFQQTFHQTMHDLGARQPPTSPTSNSDTGVEVTRRRTSIGSGTDDKTNATLTNSTSSISGSPHSYTPSLEEVAATQAGSFAALHAAHLQHQANLMAVHGQPVACGLSGPPSSPWALAGAFPQRSPFMF